MKQTLLFFMAGAAVVAAALLPSSVSAQDGPPPPTSGELLTAELANTIGGTIGPDGALYVGDPGTGGETAVVGPDGSSGTIGNTGRIVRIDTETGDITTAAEGIVSAAADDPEGGAFGVVDVVFSGNTLYFLMSGAHLGDEPLENSENGLYRVTSGGDIEQVADIGQFNLDNPVDFEDAIPDGNPFAVTLRDGVFYVTDGNHNRVLSVTTAGEIEIVTSFDNVVPTGIDSNGGPLFISNLGAFPHTPETGKVVQIGLPSGTPSDVASGFSQMIDVQFGPGGQLYAMNFGDATEDESAPPSGKIFRVSGSTLVPIVDGLLLPTSLSFSGNDAYVVTLLGQVWKIEGVSALGALPTSPTVVAPTAPAATPTRPRGVTAPDTGTGGSADGGSSSAWLIVALAAGVVALGAGAALQAKRG
jgi:sugar lactone lactonase YvrE